MRCDANATIPETEVTPAPAPSQINHYYRLLHSRAERTLDLGRVLEPAAMKLP
jgi:hypothetical protein